MNKLITCSFFFLLTLSACSAQFALTPGDEICMATRNYYVTVDCEQEPMTRSEGRGAGVKEQMDKKK